MAKKVQWLVSGRLTSGNTGTSIPFRSRIEETSRKRAIAEFRKGHEKDEITTIDAFPVEKVKQENKKLKDRIMRQERAAMSPTRSLIAETGELDCLERVNLNGEDFVNVGQLISLLRVGKKRRGAR